MEFEPNAQSILQKLVPMFLTNTILQALFEANASELASRMTAMSAATDNAGKMIQNLSIEYKSINNDNKTTLTAVKNVSLQVQRGEIYALAGESGCGKSTLAKAITKLILPKSGDIIFENKNTVTNGTKVGEYITHKAFWWDDNNDGNVDKSEATAVVNDFAMFLTGKYNVTIKIIAITLKNIRNGVLNLKRVFTIFHIP
mgnify:CR=1 FL=1